MEKHEFSTINMVKDSKRITHLGSPSLNEKGLDWTPMKTISRRMGDGGGILRG